MVNCRQLPSALERFSDLRAAAGRRRPAVFLDYDGTLTPIVERPEMAVLDEGIKGTVQRLAERTTVAVISGRDLRDVRDLVGIPDIFYAGSHGFEIEGPGGWRRDSQEVHRFDAPLDSAEKMLRSAVAGIEGAQIERKRYSMAVHYRRAPAGQIEAVKRAVAAAQDAHPDLRRTSGKKVYELQPRLDWNKGKALLWLLEALRIDTSQVLTMFIGDDITDEDGFRALAGRGIGIIVCEEARNTAASYALNSTEEVGRFLEEVAAWVARSG